MKLKPFLTLIMLIIVTSTYAQSGYRHPLQDYYYKKNIDNRRIWQRISLSVGKHYIPGKIDLHYIGVPDSQFYDTTLTRSIKSKRSYIVHLGTYFPIAIVSDQSMLVFNVELMASTTTIAYDMVMFADSGKFMHPFETYRVGIPLSLEYRLGGDVTLNKRNKSMFSVGVGILPSLNNSDDYGHRPPYKILPFVKAELGFFALVAVKVRAVGYFGNTDYVYSELYNVAQGGRGDYLKAEARGGNGFNLSVVVMPFSFKWNTYSW